MYQCVQNWSSQCVCLELNHAILLEWCNISAFDFQQILSWNKTVIMNVYVASLTTTTPLLPWSIISPSDNA